MTVDKQASPESVGAISWTTRMGTGVPFSSPLRRVRARGSGVFLGWKTTPRIRRGRPPPFRASRLVQRTDEEQARIVAGAANLRASRNISVIRRLAAGDQR